MDKREGYKKTKIGWIPEHWDVVPFGKVSNNFDGQRIPIKSGDRQEIQGDYPYYGAQGIIDYVNDYIFDGEYLLIAEDGENVKSRKNDIAFLVNGKFWVNNHAHIVQANGKSTLPFLKAKLNFISIKEYITGMAQPKLNKGKLNSILISCPPLPEQKRIASILTTVDDKISSIDDQIQQTEQLKKGLMEKLLTEGIGHTEFKDTKIGRIPKGWDICSGEKITKKITKGSSPKWQGFEYGDDGTLFVTSENVRDGFLDLSVKKFLSISFNEKQQNSTLKNKDILINIVGASIGRACIYESPYPFANINQAVCLFRLKNEIDSFFILYYLQCPSSVKRLLGTQAGSARQNLSLKDMRMFSFGIPPLEEQKQIASILSTVDDKIDVLNQKKSLYQTLKKGLSQHLLTGQMRVKV